MDNRPCNIVFVEGDATVPFFTPVGIQRGCDLGFKIDIGSWPDSIFNKIRIVEFDKGTAAIEFLYGPTMRKSVSFASWAEAVEGVKRYVCPFSLKQEEWKIVWAGMDALYKEVSESS